MKFKYNQIKINQRRCGRFKGGNEATEPFFWTKNIAC